MRVTRVTVRFAGGLHARPAVSLIRLLERFQSRVDFKTGNRIANAGSLLSILLLAATFNTQLEVRATGEDEDAAIRAAEVFFQCENEELAGRIESLPLERASGSN
jgi:phosphotransferase system HPr (HPr) family protein